MKHAVIVPAYNEGKYIGDMLQSLVTQTVPPDTIIVVDDNSTDDTASIVEDLAKQHASIRLIRGGPGEGRAYKVIAVFNVGYDMIKHKPYKYVSKLDADGIYPPNYFERIFEVMDANPHIAVGCGTIDEEINGKLVELRLPKNHCPGMLKTYRKSVFDEIGGFIPVIGWDIMDLVAVRAKGYKTISLPDIRVLHRRRHASANGILSGNMRMGRGAYIIGTHPLFMIGRAAYRMLETPYVIGGFFLWWGYVWAWLTRQERIPQVELRNALRREQLHRLINRNEIKSS